MNKLEYCFILILIWKNYNGSWDLLDMKQRETLKSSYGQTFSPHLENINGSVPHGSILDPILLLIYIQMTSQNALCWRCKYIDK